MDGVEGPSDGRLAFVLVGDGLVRIAGHLALGVEMDSAEEVVVLITIFPWKCSVLPLFPVVSRSLLIV
jgi:hypothetical protein